MVTFIALYRGQTISDARLLSVSTDPRLVAEMAARLLTDSMEAQPAGDPVVAALDRGRQRALALVAEGGSD